MLVVCGRNCFLHPYMQIVVFFFLACVSTSGSAFTYHNLLLGAHVLLLVEHKVLIEDW